MEKIIWVLGSKHPNAHRSISWSSPFPNFSNCDILIVNLQSLNSEQFQKRHSELLNEARKYIFDLLMTGEKEAIVVLSPEQSHLAWLPMFPIIRETAPIGVGKYSAKSPIDEYIKKVETCSFYIHTFDLSYFVRLTHPQDPIHENYPFTEEARLGYEPAYIEASQILNQAKQKIGGYVNFLIDYGYKQKERFMSGNLCFLPPPTKVKAEKAIDIMVNILTGGELIESPPPWENKIDLPELQDVQSQIIKKEEEKKNLIKGIGELKEKKDNLIKFRRLLWTKGTPFRKYCKRSLCLPRFS